jgi:hypothetical protein
VGTVTASSTGYFVIVTEAKIISVTSLPLLRHTIIVLELELLYRIVHGDGWLSMDMGG